MRAYQVREPWGLDMLELVELPDPRPGPGEVLVRMRAMSLNYRDLITIRGQFGARPPPPGPVFPFSDGCGVVEAVGEGVTRVAVGDRVAPMFFQGWLNGPPGPEYSATALGPPLAGVGRELAVFDQQGLSRVPDFLTDNEVATLPCAALTAWRGLFVRSPPIPGAAVVLQGTGGVSIFGLQFAIAAGCRTVVTSSSDDKLRRAAALGADHLINYRTTPEWSQAVRDATAGRGADIILEVGGPGTIEQSARAIRTGGHIAVIGFVAQAASGFNPGLFIASAAELQGVGVGSRAMFEDMCRAIDKHRIRPVIDRTYPWTDARRALEAMAAGEHFGKIVLEF